MQKIKKIIWFSLISVTIVTHKPINTAASSDKPSKLDVILPKSNEYINLNKSTFDLLMHHISNQDAFRFYGEYRAQKLNNGDFLFPLRSCDPLPIKTFGDLRYFFTSAISGAIPRAGDPIKVEDLKITNIVAVRGKEEGGYRIEAYFGYDKNNSKKLGRKRIYSATLLALLTKNTSRVENTNIYFFNGSKIARSSDIGCEIMKKGIEKGHDRNELGWKSPAFLGVFKELLGEGWSPYSGLLNGKVAENIFIRDEEVIGNGFFYSNKVYWLQNENKLKGIKYKR